MAITDWHKSHRWKFLAGGAFLTSLSAIDDAMRADGGPGGSGLVYAIPTGLLIGYGVWWLWAKNKKHEE